MYIIFKKIYKIKIGGVLLKGISGGERKRVNIGVELVANPQILLLDGNILVISF